MMQSTATSSSPAQTRSFQAPKDPMWAALIEDTDVPVAVLDANGTFEYANPAAGRILGMDAGAIVGHHLRDYFSDELVNERLSILRQVLNTSRPVAIEGMVKGRMRRSVFRPLLIAGQPSRVLVVSPVGASAPASQDAAGTLHSRANESGALASLTARELEILKLIGVGLSTADIAKKLGRSVKTVEWHRVSLGDKLGVTNRVELARIAISAGLVSLDEPAKKSEAPSDN